MQFKSVTTVLLIWALCGVDTTKAGWIEDLKAYFQKPEVRKVIISFMKGVGKTAAVEACKQAITMWAGDAVDENFQRLKNDERLAEILNQMKEDGLVDNDVNQFIVNGLKYVKMGAMELACSQVIEALTGKRDSEWENNFHSEFTDNVINADKQPSLLDGILAMDAGRFDD